MSTYRITVKPGKKIDQVTEISGEFVVITKAPANEGKANLAVIRLLAEHFKVNQAAVIIKNGHHSHKKTISINE